MRNLFFDEMQLTIDDNDFDEFFLKFDQDKNGEVSIKEFNAALKPELDKAALV